MNIVSYMSNVITVTAVSSVATVQLSLLSLPPLPLLLLLDSQNLARILQEDSRIPVILNRRSKVYIVNPTMDSGSSVERLSFGSVSFVVSSAESPRLWFVPVISVSAH